MRRQNKVIAWVIALLILAGLGTWAWQGTGRTPEQPVTAPVSSSTPTPATTTETATVPIVTPSATPATPAETATTPPKEEEMGTFAFVDHKVPFTSQAPKGGWDDERQQDGCEEASALMAMLWVRGDSISSTKAEQEILAISDYEQNTYGEFRDIGLNDVKKWIFSGYFKYDKTTVRTNISATDIIKELAAGHVLVVPMNGQKLGNPYFSGAGPERHMLLIRGYDPKKDQFITNDPGTKRGEGYRYSTQTIMNAILAYPTGHHEPVSGQPTGMVVVSK